MSTFIPKTGAGIRRVFLLFFLSRLPQFYFTAVKISFLEGNLPLDEKGDLSIHGRRTLKSRHKNDSGTEGCSIYGLAVNGSIGFV